VLSLRAGARTCDYCNAGEYSSAPETQQLILMPSGPYGPLNTGGCAGTYIRDPLGRILNGFPIFINPDVSRFIGWEPGLGSMGCAPLEWLDGIVARQGVFPSYNSNEGSPDITCCWLQYAATLTPPGDFRMTRYSCRLSD
jgi:hypothetical protein